MVKPAATHKRDGTFRPDRHSGPGVQTSIPPMPPDLCPKAQACWKHVTQILFDCDLITDLDGIHLRLFAETYALYLDACDGIREHGIMIQTDKGNLVQNPAVGTRSTCVKHLTGMCKQFGMSPVARNGLAGNGAPAEDETDEIIFGVN